MKWADIVLFQLVRKLTCCSYDQMWNATNIMMGLHGLCHSKLGETLIGNLGICNIIWAEFRVLGAYKPYFPIEKFGWILFVGSRQFLDRELSPHWATFKIHYFVVHYVLKVLWNIFFFSLYTINYAYWNIYFLFEMFSLHVYTITILNFKFRGCISARPYPLINIIFVTYT